MHVSRTTTRDKPGENGRDAVQIHTRDVLARRVVESVDLVEVVVIERVEDRRARGIDVGEVDDPARLVAPARLRRTPRPGTSGRAAARTCGPAGTFGKPVRGLEAELLEDLHHGMPRYLWVWRLSRQCGWVEAVLDRGGGVRLAVGAVHRLQEEVVEVETRRSAPGHRAACG